MKTANFNFTEEEISEEEFLICNNCGAKLQWNKAHICKLSHKSKEKVRK